jgi:hypothetical protein
MLKSGEKLQKFLTVLITWGLLLSVFLAYEQYFVKSQRAFLVEREFNALGTLSQAITAQINRAQVSTDSYVRLAHTKGQTSDTLRKYLKLYLKDVWKDTRKPLDFVSKCEEPPLTYHIEGLALSASCSVQTPGEKGKPDNVTLLPIYTLDLTPWVKNAFQPLSGDFDDLLVADSEGVVLLQKSSTGPRALELNSLIPPSEDESKKSSSSESRIQSENQSKQKGAAEAQNQKTQSKTSQEKGSQPADTSQSTKPTSQKANAFKRLAQASAVTHITPGLESYELFSQPVAMPAQAVDSDKPSTLVVCGLRRSDSLESDSRAFPYSNLIWATLITMALFSLTWPMFKLRYMSNTERFTAKEGWFLILTIFLASTSAALMLLNASYTAQATEETDVNLKKLAGQIQDQFRKEAELAYSQLQILEPKNQELVPNYLATGDQEIDLYPYFEIVYWTNAEGTQTRKFDIRPAATPLISLVQLPVFTKAVTSAKWSSNSSPDAKSPEPFYVQPLISLTTGEFAATLSAPFPKTRDKNIAVQALTFRPMSLVEPVLPPGYRFAVIGADCTVLFHSDSFRNLRENFCAESKGTSELQPLIFGGADSAVDISYAGRPERAFFTELKAPQFAQGPAFLVVFRDPDYELTLNLAVVLVCAILLGAYFAILVLFAVGHMLLRGPLRMIYAPKFMWPCAENASSYVQLAVANIFILLLFWAFYPRLYETPLLALTLLVAVVPVGFAILKLGYPRALLRSGRILIEVSVLLFTAMAILRIAYRSPALEEWWRVFVALGLFGVVAILLSGCAHWLQRLSARFLVMPDWLKRSAQDRCGLAYSLLALTVIAATSLVPAISCFKYAYDVVRELSMKHDQIALSERLLARQERIRQYYDDLRGAEMTDSFSPEGDKRIVETAKNRIGQIFDRHEKQFGFAFTCEPRLVSDFPPRDPCDPGNHQGESSPSPFQRRPINTAINLAIEKLLARIILRFPVNPLGAEMSKLGVASTDDRAAGGEHYYEEPHPNRFRLIWTPGSRLPYFSVESEYQEWQGLQSASRVLLVLLWVVMGFWLVSLVRKIFFTDVQNSPPFDPVAWKEVADIQTNFLVVGLAKSGKSKWLRSIRGISATDCLDVRVELRQSKPDRYSPQRQPHGPILILDHFEFNMKDWRYNLARLNLLESLLYDSGCKIIVVSTVDPLYFLTEGAPHVLSEGVDPEIAHCLLDRWARALSKMRKVRPEDVRDREFENKLESFVRSHPTYHQFASWIREECECTAMMRQIGMRILDEFRETDPKRRDWIESTVLDRADAYYHVLWSGLTASERLVLFQLALDGWANPKNTTALQQLERKSLIHRAPMYRIMNETFLEFVKSTEHADEIAQWEKNEGQSTWRALRLVLIALAIGTGIWLLHSQAALSQTVAAYIAGVATLLTAISGLFGRSSRQASTKAEPT